LRSRRVLDILARCLELCGFAQPENVVRDFVEREATMQEAVSWSRHARVTLPVLEVGPARPQRRGSGRHRARLVRFRDSIAWPFAVRCGSLALRLPLIGRLISRL